jgi:hypothetical protein
MFATKLADRFRYDPVRDRFHRNMSTITMPFSLPHPRGGFAILAVLAGLLLILGGGCRSTTNGPPAFAAVTLHGHPPETIRQTVATVFTEKGFYDNSRSKEWIFDRRTSTMSQWVHGGWFDRDSVRERVRLRLIPLGEGIYRLEAKAAMVRDAGEIFFEEESRMTRLRSAPYQKLLNQVERRLRQRP